MTWESKLPVKRKAKHSTSWMVRPTPKLVEWLNKKIEQHPGVSGNQIILAILEDAMSKDKP